MKHVKGDLLKFAREGFHIPAYRDYLRIRASGDSYADFLERLKKN